MCLLISAAKTNAHWGASWFQCRIFLACIRRANLVVAENGVVQLNTKDDRPSKYLQKSFQDADKSLQFFEEARLCKREATLKLISTSTCKELLQDPRRDDIEMILDLYAIELAKCEIESASVKLPGSCQFELPSGTLENGVQRTTQTELSRCLAALHSKPQWWTSYSNHRRDGYQWCLVMKPGFDHSESNNSFHTRLETLMLL